MCIRDRVAVEAKLASYVSWQRLQYCEVVLSDGTLNAVSYTHLMFGFALALALPFTLFALFPSWLKSAPKSGSWMETITIVLGFIELAFSLKFLSVAELAYGWHIMDREMCIRDR